HMTYTVDNPPGQPSGSEKSPLIPIGGGSSGSGGGPGGSGSGNPWDNPDGQNCFEKWILLATKMINETDLGPEYNARKPWSFNKYGLMEGKGIASAFAPDDWERHNRNKYWWMWDFYDTDATGGVWSDHNLKTARVPSLRDYVRRCSPASTTSTLPDG